MVTDAGNRMGASWSMVVALLYGSWVSAADLIIEATAIPRSPYVQQQVTYTLNVYRRSHLQRGYFLTPEVPDTLIRPLESRPPVYVDRGGSEYQLLEQSYLLFPQRSGSIDLPAPVFSSRDLFIQGEQLTLDVRPPPDGEDEKHWIVAEDLQLTEEWLTPEPPWQAGDRLERQISVLGTGVTAAQLPEIFPASQPGLHLQKLNSELHEELIDGKLNSRRVIRLRYLAQQAGEWRLDPFVIRWWNSGQNSAVDTRLPGRTLTFADASIQPGPSETSTASTNSAIAEDHFIVKHWSHMLIGATLLLLVPLIWPARRQLFAWLNRSLYRLYFGFRLLIACRRNDPSEIKRLLQQATKLHEGREQVFSLIALAGQTNRTDTKEALLRLDERLYSATPGRDWTCRGSLGHLLYALFLPPKQRSATKPVDLPPLWRE